MTLAPTPTQPVAVRIALALADQGEHPAWFIGHAVVFVVLAGYLINSVIHRRMLSVLVKKGAMSIEDFGQRFRFVIVVFSK